MAQGPIPVADRFDADYYASASLNISGATNVIKTGTARIRKVVVNVLGTATASAAAALVYDATAGSAASALAFAVPNAFGVNQMNWNFKTGINIVCQGGTVLSVTLA